MLATMWHYVYIQEYKTAWIAEIMNMVPACTGKTGKQGKMREVWPVRVFKHFIRKAGENLGIVGQSGKIITESKKYRFYLEGPQYLLR